MLTFKKAPVEQFFNTYFITYFTVNDTEDKLIFNSNLNGEMHIWAMDLPDTYPYLYGKVGGVSSGLTFDKENRFVVASFDNAGDENEQIYALPYDGGIPEPLITGPKEAKYFFTQLSKDGKRLYYNTSVDNPHFFDTRVRHIESGKDELLHEGDGNVTYCIRVSEDESIIIYLDFFANTFMGLFAEVHGERINLVPDPEKIHVSDSPVIVKNRYIYFATNYDADYSYVAIFDLKTKKFSVVKQFAHESVTTIEYDEQSASLLLFTEAGVQDKLYRYDLATGESVEVRLPIDIVEDVHIAKSGNVYVLGNSATTPHNIYQLTGEEGWKQLTNNRVLGFDSDVLVEPEIVTYESFDGMEIEALLFKAKPENDNGHTIFWPHGGPQAAERKSYRSMFQAFLYRGYSIFAPNFRGSTGYGATFTTLVEQDWGHGPRLDCLAGIEWLFEQNISNRERLFLIGGSYGGYMALLLHGRHPEYFKAVVDIFGVSNLFTFVESVPDHWKPIMEVWVGDPVRDKERFERDSPITYLDTMTKPMLVIQGANDPRVVKEESDQIVERLTDLGRDVEYIVLEDEGHGFTKKENEMKVYESMLSFLEKHQ